MKRIIDLAGGFLACVLLSPILALAAASVLAEDGAPVIYRRRVLGVGGREFDAFKLRTMRPDADAWLEKHPELLAAYLKNIKLDHDPRVTCVGRILRKLSIDELPQLFNVLRGEMSLVGPRMIHPSELPRYGEFGSERLTVKPGLTGLWQITVRSAADYSARIELDRRYLRERSLRLDLTILIMTIPAVLTGRGAH